MECRSAQRDVPRQCRPSQVFPKASARSTGIPARNRTGAKTPNANTNGFGFFLPAKKQETRAATHVTSNPAAVAIPAFQSWYRRRCGGEISAADQLPECSFRSVGRRIVVEHDVRKSKDEIKHDMAQLVQQHCQRHGDDGRTIHANASCQVDVIRIPGMMADSTLLMIIVSSLSGRQRSKAVHSGKVRISSKRFGQSCRTRRVQLFRKVFGETVQSRTIP